MTNKREMTQWFQAFRDGDGIRITIGIGPLDYIWQTDDQVREITLKLQNALARAPGEVTQ